MAEELLNNIKKLFDEAFETFKNKLYESDSPKNDERIVLKLKVLSNYYTEFKILLVTLGSSLKFLDLKLDKVTFADIEARLIEYRTDAYSKQIVNLKKNLKKVKSSSDFYEGLGKSSKSINDLDSLEKNIKNHFEAAARIERSIQYLLEKK